MPLDSTKQAILRDFILESAQNHHFYNDMGVVLMTIEKDEKERVKWNLWPTIDDSFMSNPPTKYFDFNGKLVLVWEGARLKSGSKHEYDNATVKACLWEKIGDRLYIKPPYRFRWTSQKPPAGSPQKRLEALRWSETGGGGGYTIIFNKDGTYQRIPMT
jgi:hypothetical protein